MTPDVVHYVPLDCIRAQPPLVLSVCGTWSNGRNWTTAEPDTTCPACLAFIALAARLQRAPAGAVRGAAPHAPQA